MSHQEISVDAIDPNPHRNFERNPIKPEQVRVIAESIDRTGFWDNIVVRRHPTKPGRFELAYGHNRLEACRLKAIAIVVLPVRELGELDMFRTMKDENETQQTITPAIAFENVEACLEMLERAFDAIGPEGTEKAFYGHLGLVVPAGTTKSKSGQDRRDGNSFEQVKSDYHAGKGIGRRFLDRFLGDDDKLSNSDINEILKSHYAAKAETEAEQAETEAQEAEQAAAASPEDQEEAERARKAREKADAMQAMAEEIAGKAIKPKILLSFETRRQMTDFAAAIRENEIPPKFHQRAADHIKEVKVYGEAMIDTLDRWWYEASGKKAKDYERIRKEEAYKAFRRRVKGGDFEAYLRDLLSRARTLTDDMGKAVETAPYYENQKMRDASCKSLKALIETASQLFNGLNGEPIEVEFTPSNGQPKQLTHL